jgi:large subunit ribosomal protein L23
MDTNILKRALISEKSFGKAAEGKFSFIVDRSATKEGVLNCVEELFGVNVLSVNILNVVGKVKRSKKGLGRRSDYKKAIVTLKKGQKIDLFEIEQPEEKKSTKAEVKKEAKETNTDTTVKVREKKK